MASTNRNSDSAATAGFGSSDFSSGVTHRTTGSSGGGGGGSEEHANADTNSGTTGSFECNICLEPAKDAVVSLCGHLFCWPCLHRWLETATARPVCPVCKASISRDKVVPLYGRGTDSSQDPRSKVPPRPRGQRTEPESNSAGFASGFANLFGTRDNAVNAGNFRMSIGVGTFPFGLFTSTFQFGGNRPEPDNLQSDHLAGQNDAEVLSRCCLFLALFFLIWLIFA